MKVFLIFSLIIHVVHPYVLDLVPGVVGFVKHVDFDSDGNIYAVASVENRKDERSNYTLFKLSSKRELLSTVNLPYEISLVYKMQVTTGGDVYFYFFEPINDGHYNDTIAVVRSGSKIVEILEPVSGLFMYLDPFDNLYYGKEAGIHILRPGSRTPILIKNLEDFDVSFTQSETATADNEGNIYLAVHGKRTYKDSVVLLAKEELQNEVPEAKHIKLLDTLGEGISDIIVDERNNIWVITDAITKGLIKKLTNGTYETIKMDPIHPDLDVTAAKDRLWVVAADSSNIISPSIYYITLDNEVVNIPELQNLTGQMYFFSESLADKDGIAYFKTFDAFTPDLGPMIIINPGEIKPMPVHFFPNDPNTNVDDIFMDMNEDVWVFRQHWGTNDYIYVIKKGETTANVIQNFHQVCTNVYSNPVTREIFLSCGNGLILAFNEKQIL